MEINNTNTIKLEFLQDDEIKYIEIKLRFKTPELHTKILKLDSDMQKKGKKLNDTVDFKEALKKSKEINDKINKEIEKYKLEHADWNDEDIINFSNELNIKASEEFTTEDIDKTFTMNKVINNFSNESLIEFIKLIAIPVSDKELFFGKEIWNYANLEQLEDIRDSFRSRYKL